MAPIDTGLHTEEEFAFSSQAEAEAQTWVLISECDKLEIE